MSKYTSIYTSFLIKTFQSNVRTTQHAATIAIRIIKNCAKHEKYLKKTPYFLR